MGQMIPMAAIGVASMISLWILGAHLMFIPYLGTVLPGILAILLSLQRSFGVAVAAPLTAVGLVLVKSVYPKAASFS